MTSADGFQNDASATAPQRSRPRLLILVVAYNAEKTIDAVVARIPVSLTQEYDAEILILDDASDDATFLHSHTVGRRQQTPFPIRVLFHARRDGYGAIQKLGYQYGIENGFDFVTLLHGDGQYAPESLPDLVEPLRSGEAAAVLGSRMTTRWGALRDGMPFYKFLGNRILTSLENRLLHTQFSELQCGYRAYSLAALRTVPFARNANGFVFDTELAIQLLIAGRSIREVPVPTYSGDEIRSVNGLLYATKVLATAIKARLQELSLFYDRRFDCAPPETYSPYTLKLHYTSPHSMTRERVPAGVRVLDLGCAGGYMGAVLRSQKRCFVRGLDVTPVKDGILDEFAIHDLNGGVPPLGPGQYDVLLLLDVIEHLNRPEAFLEEMHRALGASPRTEVILSTGNVACLVTRLMLAAGQFNYGKRGILDVTHTRLFTFASMKRALVQAGFDILETTGVPAPFPLAIGDNFFSGAFLAVNRLAIRLSRGLFAYQIFMRVRAQPTLESLLRDAEGTSRERLDRLEAEQTNTIG
jgi:2-polyprenyl-3-methyl-5-hydroxy-6-metoxy-1,4-benzoquinol methylase/glycosyltransferase involved in cell wall biosynthesis